MQWGGITPGMNLTWGGHSAPVGLTLYYGYAPCVFSLKIIGPLLRTACTESHPPIADRYKIYPLLIAEQGIPFCRHTKMFMDRAGQLLAYTGSWRGVQPGQGTGVEPGGLWSREFIAFISKIFRKVNTWGLLRERACFGGLQQVSLLELSINKKEIHVS
jgi:hypothetical protein